MTVFWQLLPKLQSVNCPLNAPSSLETQVMARQPFSTFLMQGPKSEKSSTLFETLVPSCTVIVNFFSGMQVVWFFWIVATPVLQWNENVRCWKIQPVLGPELFTQEVKLL